jgi:hypothetical protein
MFFKYYEVINNYLIEADIGVVTKAREMNTTCSIEG